MLKPLASIAVLLVSLPLTRWLAAAEVIQPAPDIAISRIAFGSCAFQSVPQPIFKAVVHRNPDVYLSLGDAIYGDYDAQKKQTYAVTPDTLRREWQVLADNADWQYLVKHVPVMATWDNHDYGHHSAGEEFPLKAESKEIFLDFFGEPPESDRRKTAGIYDSRVFGPAGKRVQIVLLDTRSFKSIPRLASRPDDIGGSLGKYAPQTGVGATLLGEEQWAWLMGQLAEPADVRIIASSGQVIADQKGMDEWGNYPIDRRRLLKLLTGDGVGPVLLLTGNAHFSEVSATRVGARHLLDFTSSGLTHINEAYAAVDNPYRIAGPFAAENFGLVEIEWNGRDVSLVLSAIDAKGGVAFTHRFDVPR